MTNEGVKTDNLLEALGRCLVLCEGWTFQESINARLAVGILAVTFGIQFVLKLWATLVIKMLCTLSLSLSIYYPPINEHTQHSLLIRESAACTFSSVDISRDRIVLKKDRTGLGTGFIR